MKVNPEPKETNNDTFAEEREELEKENFEALEDPFEEDEDFTESKYLFI